MIDKYTRYGYILEIVMSQVLKRREFLRWQIRENLPDTSLCKAVQDLDHGLFAADLGGHLFKVRIARPGHGKRSGYRTLLSARLGNRYVFMLGFSKNDRSNIEPVEQRALQYVGKVFLELDADGLAAALRSGVLIEVPCEQHH